MLMSHRGSGPVAPAIPASRRLALGGRLSRRAGRGRLPRYIFGTVMAASLSLSVAQAATFGHSRIVSALGQPLHLEIPVTQLTQQEIESLRAVPAPAEAWRAAGMTPPVPLESMRLLLLDGYRPDVKVIQLRSDQVFDQPIVDVLLDVRSVSGQQRYQVSLLAHADPHAIRRAGGESARNPRVIDGRGAAALPGSHAAAGRQITVRQGDNMFDIARRNAVQGVTVYQMMMALQRSNQHAFIEDNVNLVKAGATLTMPDMDTLTALSDREARRIFQQHAQAFARYRQRSAAADVAMVSTVDTAAQGAVSEVAPASVTPEAAAVPAGSGDRLRLSGGPESSLTASAGAAPGSALGDRAAVASTTRQGSSADADASAVESSGNGTANASHAMNRSGHAVDGMAQAGGAGQASDAGSRVQPGSGSDRIGNGAALPGQSPASANGAEATAQAHEASPIAASVSGAAGEVRAAEAAPQNGDAASASSASSASAASATSATSATSSASAASTASAAAQAPSQSHLMGQADTAAGGNGSATPQTPAVSLLASSGAIASDAVADKAPIAVAGDTTGQQSEVFGSDAASGGTVLEAGAAPRHPDDVAASKKGVDESKKRILELEDNVRHLNQALQQQGHVAAEAALEGARSVSEAIKEVMSLVDPDDEPAATEAQAPAASAGTSTGSAGGEAGNGAADPVRAGAEPSSPESPAARPAPVGREAVPSGSFVQEGPFSQSETSVRTEKKVSWMQENMLALIGGGLAFIVALVVWLLRRAGGAKRDAFESDSPITDSMLHDKLREIDLDLDAPSSGGAGPRV